MQRPDCQVEVKFKVRDVPGTVTSSTTPHLCDAVIKFVAEELGGYDIEIEATPIEEVS